MPADADAESPAKAPNLTRREHEVLSLVALGWTNCEVAGRLAISARTVEKHLEHVYAKLGVSGRFGAMQQVAERTLVRAPTYL